MATHDLKLAIKAEASGIPEVEKLRASIGELGKLDAFKRLKSDVLSAEKAWKSAEGEVARLAREIKGAEKPTAALRREFNRAVKQSRDLKQEFNGKQKALHTLRGDLSAAGIDTKQYAAEQERLERALAGTRKEAQKAAKLQAARGLLDVDGPRKTRLEIDRLREAYDRLKRSGTATSGELAVAKANLRKQVKALSGETTGLLTIVGKARLGTVALLAGAGYAAVSAARDYGQFKSAMAEVNTMLDVSQPRFQRLSDDVLDLSTRIPQTAKQLADAEYQILSAGVDLEKSIGVLGLAANAATAGVTDTKTAVETGLAVINAYDRSIEELEQVYDTLFATIQSGVTTFPALSASIGDILPTARSADVEFSKVAAALATLTKAGVKTPKAATAIKGAINAMAAPAPEAKKRFAELGITWQGLIPTLEQIAAKGLTLDQMRLLIPDEEARTGVLALTQNLDRLKSILKDVETGTGSMAEANGKIMENDPSRQVQLLVNKWTALKNTWSEVASGPALKIIEALSGVADAVRDANRYVAEQGTRTLRSLEAVEERLAEVRERYAEFATVPVAETDIWEMPKASLEGYIEQLNNAQAYVKASIALEEHRLKKFQAWGDLGKEQAEETKARLAELQEKQEAYTQAMLAAQDTLAKRGAYATMAALEVVKAIDAEAAAWKKIPGLTRQVYEALDETTKKDIESGKTAEQVADKIVAARRKVIDQLEGQFNKETTARRAQLDQQLADIELAEAEGVITKEQAVKKKIELEAKAAQATVSAWDEYFKNNEGLLEQDTQAYEQAMLQRQAAVTELTKAMAALRRLESEPAGGGKEPFKPIADGADKAKEKIEEVTDSLEGSAGAIATFDEVLRRHYDEQNTTYETLTQNLENLNGMIARATGADSGTTRIVGHMEDAKRAFEEVNSEVRKYGVELDLSNMTLDQAKQKAQALKDEFESITQRMADMQRDLDEELRTIKKAGLSDEEQYRSDVKRYQELMAEASSAAGAGNYELALSLYEDAKRLARGLAQEVKDLNGEVVISMEQATAKAVKLMEDAGARAIETMKRLRANVGGDMAEGRYAYGGWIGGRSHTQGGTLIEAERGEYIHPIAAVRKYGLRFMEAVRRQIFPAEVIRALMAGRIQVPRFALGGVVPQMPKVDLGALLPAASSPAVGKVVEVRIADAVGQAATLQGSAMDVEGFLSILERHRLRS